MDGQALNYFVWGANSWVCAGSNFLADKYVVLYRACVIERDFDKDRRIMRAMMPLMSVLAQGGKFIQSVKYGVILAGRFTGVAHKPLLDPNETEKRQLESIISTLKA